MLAPAREGTQAMLCLGGILVHTDIFGGSPVIGAMELGVTETVSGSVEGPVWKGDVGAYKYIE